MNELTQSLLLAFANNFTYYLKSHNYHWVVMGEDFPQYHKVLEKIYTDAQENIDNYAEQLRRLGAFPMGDYASIVSETELTDKPEQLVDAEVMFQNLLDDLDILVPRLQDTFDLATTQREYGLQNFLADRIDLHRKTQWILTSILTPVPDEDQMGQPMDQIAADTTSSYQSGPTGSPEACPVATQDIAVNLKNRQTAIDKAHYGPLDPSKPNTAFWQQKGKMWNITPDQAKSSRCGNCAAFNQSPGILDCINSGLAAGGSGARDAWATIDAGDLGYCEAWDFKCAASRTCDAWITGGPITQ